MATDLNALQQQVSARWAEIEALIKSDPDLARRAQNNPKGVPLGRAQALTLAARKIGIAVPDGYNVGLTGRVQKSDSLGKALLTAGAIVGGTALGGAVLNGAFAGGAAPVAGGVTGAGSGIGTTAGAVVGGVAPVSKAYSWLSPLLRTVVPVAGQVIGGLLQNNANKNADEIQRDALDKALAAEQEQQRYERGRDKEQTGYNRRRDEEQQTYGRSQYANYLGRLDPYAQAGPPAVSRLTDVLGRPGAIPQVGNGAMITLRSPDGQTQQVPQEHADWYLSRGATRV